MKPQEVMAIDIVYMFIIMLHVLWIIMTLAYAFGTSHQNMVALASMVVTYCFIALIATDSVLYMWSLLNVEALLKWVMTSFVLYLMLLIALPLIQMCD